MTTRFTSQGCKVETTCTIQPNGTYTESVTLSVDPASVLSLAIEDYAGQPVPVPVLPARGSTRVRATRHGFELVERR